MLHRGQGICQVGNRDILTSFDSLSSEFLSPKK
jgi:hypothetical protein